jgi:acetate kinase
MGTRSGDLDPSVLLHLARSRQASVDTLTRLVNQEAGLLGVSGTSSDMRDLLARERDDARAAEAVALFCYTARKFTGALVAVLGGLDMLVFTGGIGEHAAAIRARICDGLDCFGVRLDAGRNATHAPVISSEGTSVMVRVMQTDEDLMIARHMRRLLSHAGGDDVSI